METTFTVCNCSCCLEKYSAPAARSAAEAVSEAWDGGVISDSMFAPFVLRRLALD